MTKAISFDDVEDAQAEADAWRLRALAAEGELAKWNHPFEGEGDERLRAAQEQYESMPGSAAAMAVYLVALQHALLHTRKMYEAKCDECVALEAAQAARAEPGPVVCACGHGMGHHRDGPGCMARYHMESAESCECQKWRPVRRV